jgi:hypothetical protein
MPNITSPSSKEHEKYNGKYGWAEARAQLSLYLSLFDTGLRPTTARSENLVINTKKIELKYF